MYRWYLRKIVQRAVTELLYKEDATLRNHMFHIAFGCHVLYKIITLSVVFLNGRICLFLKDRRGGQTIIWTKRCCSSLCFPLSKVTEFP